jgi:gliding motility-associated lipoprotein GldH
MFLPACESHDHISTTEPEGACWEMHDSLVLPFSVSDTTLAWNLTFPLRFTDDYPYSNLYVQLATYTPSGESGKATYRFRLMDELGNWDGEYAGSAIRYVAAVGPGIKFNQLGDYRLVLRHFMRDETLCGIQSAGIALDQLP